MSKCMYNIQGAYVCIPSNQINENFEEPQISLPVGSYNIKCKNCTLTDNKLSCICKNNRGTYSKNTQIEMADCIGKDINIDYEGNLICKLPKGSYLDTCQACSVQNNTLSCMCMNPYHQYINSTLDIKHCNEITNKDGKLTCEKTM
jgi:hypothetical protein